jgi:glutathione S-transferase
MAMAFIRSVLASANPLGRKRRRQAGEMAVRMPAMKRNEMEEKTTKHDPRIVIQALASLGTTLLRPNRGLIATGHRAQPLMLLELYEAEYCPFCRPVREALTELDLDARIFPIPKKGTRYRDQLLANSGAKKIPFLHDRNTGVKLHESQAIVEYLYKQYGIEGIPAPAPNLKTSMLATASRGTNGMFAAPSVPATKALELYSFEGSPYCRLVREVLCELEATYILRNVGKSPGSYADFFPPILRHNNMKSYLPATVNRQKFIERAGLMMVPYLVDPNTGRSMWETGDIQEYLRETYGRKQDTAPKPVAAERRTSGRKPAAVKKPAPARKPTTTGNGADATKRSTASKRATSGNGAKARKHAAPGNGD